MQQALEDREKIEQILEKRRQARIEEIQYAREKVSCFFLSQSLRL